MDKLGGFWIIGIAVNVTLTVLALGWLFRQMRKPRLPPTDDTTASNDQPPD